jgi:hypothetical protein
MSFCTKSGLGVQSPEATQFIQAQAGCSESLSQLMACHDGVAQAVVRQQVLGKLPFEESLQGESHWPVACDPGESGASPSPPTPGLPYGLGPPLRLISRVSSEF